MQKHRKKKKKKQKNVKKVDNLRCNEVYFEEQQK